MEITGRIIRQMSLISLLVLIAPVILFPDRLGTGLAESSLLSIVLELAFYVVVIYFFFRSFAPLKIIKAVGACLVCRLALGAVFGFLVATMYPMSLSISLRLGMVSYLPAVLLHIAATPFILKLLVAQWFVSSPKSQRRPLENPIKTGLKTNKAMPAAPAAKDRVPTRVAVTLAPELQPLRPQEVHVESSSRPDSEEANGFDRASRYIGEDSSVQLAAVVDHEGLLLGQFRRDSADADRWAPLALLFGEVNGRILHKAGWGLPEKIDLVVKDSRIVVARRDWWRLIVVGRRQGSDLLNIRINQGLEIISNYVTQRYDRKPAGNAEKIYVSSTK